MIFSNKFCFSVAKELARVIEEISGVRLFVSTRPDSTRDRKVHIRYGGVIPTLSKEPDLNSVDFIRLSSNKKTFSDLLLKEKIRTVEFKPKKEYTSGMGTVLVRDSLSSFGGRGITLCHTKEEVDRSNGYWMSPYINFTDEYRVHIFNGTIIRIQKKVNGSNEQEEFPIRNHSRGYFFSVRTTNNNGMENFPALQGFVEGVTDLFPEKHFCGLDIGKNGKNHYVIENNSAIGLEVSTLYLYASKFCEEFGWKVKVNLDDYILPTTEEGDTDGIHRTERNL